jgi:hypothetical protein
MIHDAYNRLLPSQKKAVDRAYKAAHEVLALEGMNPQGDDRAERVVEALAVFLLACDDEVTNA